MIFVWIVFGLVCVWIVKELIKLVFYNDDPFHS